MNGRWVGGQVTLRRVLAAAVTSYVAAIEARDLTGPGASAEINQGDAEESWRLRQGAALRMNEGSTAGAIALDASRLESYGGFIQCDRATGNAGQALDLTTSSVATLRNTSITNQYGFGVRLNLGAMPDDPSFRSNELTAVDSHIEGLGRGINLASNSTVNLQGTSVRGSLRQLRPDFTEGSAVALISGTLNLTQGSHLQGDLQGIWVVEDTRGFTSGGTFINLDQSIVEGKDQAILVNGFSGKYTASHPLIHLRNGSELRSDSGVLVRVGEDSSADIRVENSALIGDLITDDSSSLSLLLSDYARFSGVTSGHVDAVVGDTAIFNSLGDSQLASLALMGGKLELGAGESFDQLTVRGDMSGAGGVIGMSVQLNAGGALSNQWATRLLVNGDVATTGTTWLDVHGIGDGALTDLNRNGKIDANEGISLVQVAGESRSDAFALRGGYVAAGPWQYVLQAFGPGEADASQNMLPSGELSWDYRLGNREVDGGGDPPDPPAVVDPPGVVDPPSPPPGVRPAVVPQLTSYLVAPIAMLNVGDVLNDSMRRRLGDFRQKGVAGDLGGESFARVIANQARYSSELGFQDFGFDFHQQINALQVGAGLLAIDAGQGALRAGWAADRATTRVTPKAVDGGSRAKYTVNGASAWMSWSAPRGLYVDAVFQGTRFRGDVGTDARGSDVARVRGRGWSVSVEAGYSFSMGKNWVVESQLQLKRMTQRFDSINDVDQLETRIKGARLTQLRAGAMLSRIAKASFAPYARLDLTGSFSGRANAAISGDDWNSADNFRVGRMGNAYRVAVGATAQLGRSVQVYGEGTYQHQLGHYGVRGWSANAGVRINF